jgi:hypothetical protein
MPEPTGLGPGLVDLDLPLAVHDLTFLPDGDEVTVGRAAVESYAVLPADGAELLRRLSTGETPRAAARWYQQTYGESVDIAEFVATLAELEFLRSGDEPAPAGPTGPLPGQRLGQALFSRPAWLLYGLLAAATAVAIGRHADLAPHYRNAFFTRYLTVVELVLFVGQFPLLLVHEGFHALAGRRLGLRSGFGIGRRLYYLVFETSLDGLVTVPRRQRYLPMLAGMLADVLVFSALTLAADLTRRPDGSFSAGGGICLALAFGTVLRFVWQLYFYLQTDIYHVVCVVLGCHDLQSAARGVLRNRVNRLLGRTDRLLDESQWHPRDLRAARWYSWLLPAGYAFSIGTLLLAGIPTAVRFISGVFGRFGGGGASGAELADSAGFLALNLAQLGAVAALVIRDRRRRRTS